MAEKWLFSICNERSIKCAELCPAVTAAIFALCLKTANCILDITLLAVNMINDAILVLMADVGWTQLQEEIWRERIRSMHHRSIAKCISRKDGGYFIARVFGRSHKKNRDQEKIHGKIALSSAHFIERKRDWQKQFMSERHHEIYAIYYTVDALAHFSRRSTGTMFFVQRGASKHWMLYVTEAETATAFCSPQTGWNEAVENDVWFWFQCTFLCIFSPIFPFSAVPFPSFWCDSAHVIPRNIAHGLWIFFNY